jgi:hypothetical protein
LKSISQTFHVKCYWLSGQVDTWYAIGSNNLTAGGLFSNYEISVMSHNTGKEASDANIRLEAIYKSYASSTSYCSRSVDKHFLQELLTSDYIVKEIQLRRAIATLAKKKRSFSATKQQHLFGNEIFSAPTLPTEFKKKQQKWVSTKKVQPQNVMLPQAVAPDDIQVNDNLYLIRLVPSAGDRSKQVHFTKELLSSYFCLTPGDNILVQEMLPSGGVGKIEQRQIVLSQRNQNVKIELAGAAILNDNYPSNPETKPVLIIKRINSNLFVYMLLLDGSDGYAAINNHLKSLPPRRWFPFEVIDEDAMFSLWSDCPLM